MSTEYELFYWGGNFAGRGEYVRLVLSLSGKTWRDVGREEGSPKVFEYIKSKQPNGTFPVCFPPILKHGDIVINQLPAVLVYLGKLHGLFPEDALAAARVLQVSLTALDALSGAEKAYHPVNGHDAYANQVEEAKPTIAGFMENRLPIFLENIEKSLLMNDGGKGYFVGETMTIADIVVYNFMRGYRSSQQEHFANNSGIAAVKAFVQRMDEHEGIKAFWESDQCTKMENPDNTPLSKPPLVQVNSFM